MITMLRNWKGSVEINGSRYDSMDAVISAGISLDGNCHIKLFPSISKPITTGGNAQISQDYNGQEYRITVKRYMTKPTEPGSTFDFMQKFNNDHPMPMRTMTGWIEKQTRGMVYMHLHGDIWAEKICTCMCCGKKLTNPVSQYFGIGPECGGHNYVNPFNSDEELKEAVAEYKKDCDIRRVRKLLNHNDEAITMLYALADELTARAHRPHTKKPPV